MTGRQEADEIEREAARWVMRLDLDGAEHLRAEAEAWAAGDVRRRGALLQAEAAWATLDAMRRENPGTISTASAPGLRRRSVIAGLGAAAASIAVAYLLIPRPDRYETIIGEIRRVPLQDRSAMTINTATRVDIDYAAASRRVTLERGEAWFQVAKDRARPFVVEAGPIRVRAVGTAFSVRRRDGGAEVVVTEGVVRAWVVGAEPRAIELGAGAAAFIADDPAARPSIDGEAGIQRRLAWRSGRLDLAGETLGEAVAELNRYSATHIVIQDPILSRKRLYGVFRLDEPEVFARTAAMTLGGSVVNRGDSIEIVGRQGLSELLATPPGIASGGH